AMNKAGGACPGSIAAIESLVDSCVNTLEPDSPGTGKCPSGTAKALGKAASAELSCSAKDLSKPGSFGVCHAKADFKLTAAFAQAGNCEAGTSQSDVHDCQATIAGALPPTTTTSTSTSSTTTTSTSTTTSSSTTSSTSTSTSSTTSTSTSTTTSTSST